MVKIKHIEGSFFKAVYEDYQDDPLPSRSERGRFHIGPQKITYLAEKKETSWKEVQKHFIDTANPEAYKFFEFKIEDLEEVVDLTDEETQAHYGVNEEVLTANDYQPIQSLASRIKSEGYKGIWTYSAADRPKGRVLVIFLDKYPHDKIKRVTE